MTRDQVEDECWTLADAYRLASVQRGRAEGRLAARPDDPKAREARFDAGMAEANAWTMLLGRSGDLMALDGLGAAAEVREAAIRTAMAAGLAALKAELREAASDAA